MSPQPSGCDFSFSADESPFFPHILPFHCFATQRAAESGAGKNFPWKRARDAAKNPTPLSAVCFANSLPLQLENAFPELSNHPLAYISL